MVVNVSEFNTEFFRSVDILPAPRGNRGTKVKNKYLDCICAFDIETTRIKCIEQSIMYVWQFQIDEDITVIGRTWQDFIKFLYGIMQNTPEESKLVIYVHNLSYEFTFLKGIYHFKSEEVFALDDRKVLKCSMFDRFEFRCSYLQTNMSLKEFTSKFHVKHVKLDDFVYAGERYPWTELSARELEYCVNDVLGLVEALKAEMLRDNDTLYTIPMTSTGYVRRDVKEAMRSISHYYIREIQPDWNVYTLLHDAFRGGNTHANRFFVTSADNQTILQNVHSADRSSSYPEVLCNELFPVKPFFEVQKSKTNEQHLRELITERGKACLFRAILEHVTLKDKYFGCPYIPKSKCRNIINGVFDNGRVLSADYLEIALTDIDLKIIDMEYNYILTPEVIYYSTYGRLPNALKNVIIQYYKGKTELKGVAGQEVYYMKNKNLLNAIYGMMATNPVRDKILYDLNGKDIYGKHKEFLPDNEQDKPAELVKANMKAFLSYAWGVWTTAHARYALECGIHLAHYQNPDVFFIYADTDSVKYIGNIDWTEYNTGRIAASTESGAYATDPKGVTHYMGVFEQEDDYSEFATMGAKKYAGRGVPKKAKEFLSGKRKGSVLRPCSDGTYKLDAKLHITIAGVSKKLGGSELERAGGLEAFKEEFTFVAAGGLEAVYNDIPEITSYSPDGVHTVEITSNVVLRESTYTLGLTADYMRILTLSKIELDKLFNDVLEYL